jgi:hypothetical protein
MKNILLCTVIILCVFISPLQAQAPDSLSHILHNRKNGVMVGFLGNAPLFSLNFHRQLLQFKNQQGQYTGFMEVAVGIGLEPDIAFFGGTTKWYPTLPHSLTFNFGKNKHYLEIGYGGMLENKRLISYNNYLITPIIGWRYKASKGFMFRFHFSPWLHTTNEGIDNVTKMIPMGGISLGKNF